MKAKKALPLMLGLKKGVVDIRTSSGAVRLKRRVAVLHWLKLGFESLRLYFRLAKRCQYFC